MSVASHPIAMYKSWCYLGVLLVKKNVLVCVLSLPRLAEQRLVLSDGHAETRINQKEKKRNGEGGSSIPWNDGGAPCHHAVLAQRQQEFLRTVGHAVCWQEAEAEGKSWHTSVWYYVTVSSIPRIVITFLQKKYKGSARVNLAKYRPSTLDTKEFSRMHNVDALDFSHVNILRTIHWNAFHLVCSECVMLYQ